MNATNVLNSMNGISMELIEEAEQSTFPKSHSAIKISLSIAACLSVLTAALLTYHFLTPKQPTLITAENSLGHFISASLARPPYKGEVWRTFYLSSDISARGDAAADMVYWVEITFHSEDASAGSVNMNQAMTAAECKKLAALGYELYTHEFDWTGYWGEPKHFTTVCGVLSTQQMDDLAELSSYGCYLDFAMKSPEECMRVEP